MVLLQYLIYNRGIFGSYVLCRFLRRAEQGPVIVLDYNVLKADRDHGDAIKRAYGVDGLGILVSCFCIT